MRPDSFPTAGLHFRNVLLRAGFGKPPWAEEDDRFFELRPLVIGLLLRLHGAAAVSLLHPILPNGRAVTTSVEHDRVVDVATRARRQHYELLVYPLQFWFAGDFG